MNQREMFECQERIARGEPCDACGSPWLTISMVPHQEELVHQPWCEYLARTSPEKHTVEWIDEENHARVHVAVNWDDPLNVGVWHHDIVVVDRDEMADYNRGTRIILERWMAEETE